MQLVWQWLGAIFIGVLIGLTWAIWPIGRKTYSTRRNVWSYAIIIGCGGLFIFFASRLSVSWLGIRIVPVYLTALLSNLVVYLGSPVFGGLLAYAWLKSKSTKWRRLSIAMSTIGFAIIAIVIAENASSAAQINSAEMPIAPPGFTISMINDQVKAPTSLAFDPQGNLYASETNGQINLLRNTGEAIWPAAAFANVSGLTTGILFHIDTLYVSTAKGQGHTGQVIALRDTNGDGISDEQTVLVSGLPAQIFDSHQNNGLAIGPDGRLYIAVGGTSDHGPETDPLGGTIISVKLDGSDLQIFATGLRNPYDLAFAPDGTLWAPDNGPNWLDSQFLFAPPDELNQIDQGHDYGYPAMYGGNETGKSYPPVAMFPSGSAPTGLTFYTATQFPAEYRGDIFVAQWQSVEFRLSPGQRVVRIKAINTAAQRTYEVEPFITNLQGPTDVAVGPDGALYIADQSAYRIYRVAYGP